MSQPESIQLELIPTVLQNAIDQRCPATMSHLSRGKWHISRVLITALVNGRLYIELAPKDKPRPINIVPDQPVGISFKLGYNKFIFDAVVAALEPSADRTGAGRIVLHIPDRMEKLQRRNFFRVPVPAGLTIKVLFWHRSFSDGPNQTPLENYWQGRLLDISAGGTQISIPRDQNPTFKTGQLLGLQFTPMPYETPMLLEGQVRHIAPTADNAHLTLGIQIIGLEAGPDGRQKLHRLCAIVEQYHQMNQTATTPTPTPNPTTT